jgi:hypothetical protein
LRITFSSPIKALLHKGKKTIDSALLNDRRVLLTLRYAEADALDDDIDDFKLLILKP